MKNTGTDANRYGYVYLKYFEKQPQGSTVETYVDIVDEVTGEWRGETKTVDLSGKYFAYSMDIRYCSLTKNSTDDSYGDQAIANATAGNGLYWKESLIVNELPWYSEEILRLYPGDEVCFTLPDGGKKDCFYQLYVATCYPDEEDRSVTYYPTTADWVSYTYFNLMVDDFAYASTQNVLVDGKSVEFQCYALKDENGNDTNYIKLRDVASILNGTTAQFNVGWDGNVNMEIGKAYVSNGSEMSTPFSGNRAYENATTATNVNGKAADLNAIVLKDDAGSGYTYYKLRDLGNALGFKVDWSAEKGIFIETN